MPRELFSKTQIVDAVYRGIEARPDSTGVVMLTFNVHLLPETERGPTWAVSPTGNRVWDDILREVVPPLQKSLPADPQRF